jgi:hypothetical protein
VSPCKHPEADKAIAYAIRLRGLGVVNQFQNITSTSHRVPPAEGDTQCPWSSGSSRSDWQSW